MPAVSKVQAKLFRIDGADKDKKLNHHDASDKSAYIDNYVNTDDTNLTERVPLKLKEYDQYALSANGQVAMGTKGDASFFGPDAKMKGGAKRSVYKVPKSSIHYNSNKKKDLPPEFDDEEDIKKTHYIADKSVPKNSIHNEKFGVKNEDAQDGSGTNSMGTVGDSSFIGKSGIRMGGNNRKPVYKTPKSSVHYKKGRFPDESDFYDEDNWETEKSIPSPAIAGKTAYIADKSVPTNSIHYGDKPDEDRHYISTQEQLGIPIAADGTIEGGPRSMDPIASKKTKKKKFADASKYGYPKKEKNVKENFIMENNPNKIPKESLDFIKQVAIDHAEDIDIIKNFGELDKKHKDIIKRNPEKWEEKWINAIIKFLNKYPNLTDEQINEVIFSAFMGVNETSFDGGGKLSYELHDKYLMPASWEFINMSKPTNEIKDYDTNIVPKTSIHYGERDKVPGETKMKFEKRITKEAGFIPDVIKNLKTQGDWQSNLNKSVMDLTGEAQPNETSVPVPKEEFGNTPEFPYANETDGTMIYPIPGIGIAIKKGDEWTFGDTPQLPATAMQGAESELQGQSCSGFGEPYDDTEIDIPCTKRPLIKKLLMFIKNEQKNLHEGIALKGIYEGKVVKLNTIFEGEHRMFKTYVKTNEGKIKKIHFGPDKTEECGMMKKKKEIREYDSYDMGQYKHDSKNKTYSFLDMVAFAEYCRKHQGSISELLLQWENNK